MNKKHLIFLLMIVLFINLPTVLAYDGLNNTDTIYNDNYLVDMGTEEMPDLSPDNLNIDNFTSKITEKEIKNATEEENAMVYASDDYKIMSNSYNSASSNYKIVINNNMIYQFDQLIVHFETLSDNQFIKLSQNSPFKFTINGISYTRYTNEYGLCKMNIKLPVSSTPYSIKIEFLGNEQYVSSYTNVNIWVFQKTAILTPITTHIKQNKQFHVKLTDDTGVPIAKCNVTIGINGVNYIRTTNATGVAKLNVYLNPNTYSTSYSFAGQNGYGSISTQSVNLVVNSDITRTNTKLTPLTTFVKTNEQFKVKLTTESGVALSGKTVIIQINGIYYAKTTNASGIAKINIKLNQNTYAVTVNHVGDASYNAASAYILIHTSNSDKNNINTISNLATYKTAIGPNCNPTNTFIQNLGNSLTSSCQSDLEKIIAIHNYVYKFKKEAYSNTRYGDLNALLVNNGNCADHTHAFISLARANNLPVRYVIGNGTPGHAWGQICIDDMWIVADPTNTLLFGNFNSGEYSPIYYYITISI